MVPPLERLGQVDAAERAASTFSPGFRRVEPAALAQNMFSCFRR
jgi:hypothetical protein